MLKKRAKMPDGIKRVKMQIGKYAAAVMIICGLVGAGPFFLCAEAAQTTTEIQDDGSTELLDNTGQGLVLEAEKRIEMKAAPEETAETLMTFQPGDLIFAAGAAADGWYHVVYQEKEGYVEMDGLTVLEIDTAGLDAEMAANEEETKFVVEVVEKYRADARRSKIWGTIIIVLVIGIFGVGIFSAVKTDKNEDGEKSGEKNGEEGREKGRNKGAEKRKAKREPEQIEIKDLDGEDLK